MIKLETLSAVKIGELVNSGLIRPIEVVKYFEERIDRINPRINAFVYLNYDYAEKRALEIEELLRQGVKVGPLAGVPFALKDFLPSKKGWYHDYGGVKSLTKIDEYDSEFCKAIESLGGIAIGKTNSPSFGFRGTCYNRLYGNTSNPFDLERNSGGSSGGSASAVGAGLVPIAEGGDAGGSIRIPASWCNCFGFKASKGVIPNVCRPDGWAATHPYCSNGCITRNVEDSKLIYNKMIQYDIKDPLANSTTLLPNYNNSVYSLKIAAIVDFGIFNVNEEVKQKFLDYIKQLRMNGYSVDIINVNLNRSLKDLADTWCRGISFDTTVELELLKKEEGLDLLKDCKEELPDEFIYWTKQVQNSNFMDLYHFNVVRTELYDMQNEIFKNYDYLLTPVSTCLPLLNTETEDGPKAKSAEELIGIAETFLFNYTGNPAAAIPMGLTKDNLPLGIQVVSAIGSDKRLLAFSEILERKIPWKQNFDNIKVDF